MTIGLAHPAGLAYQLLAVAVLEAVLFLPLEFLVFMRTDEPTVAGSGPADGQGPSPPESASVVTDAYWQPRLPQNRPKAISSAGHDHHGRRGDRGHDLGSPLLRENALGAARRPMGDAGRGPAAPAPEPGRRVHRAHPAGLPPGSGRHPGPRGRGHG